MKLKLGKFRLRKIKEPREHDIYTEKGLCQKTEGDEITSREEGFMKGWLSCCQ